MNESFSDQESRRRFVVVSAAVAICLLGTLLYLSTSSRRLKNRNAPSGAQTGVLRAAADTPANFPASAAELARVANTISRHSSPTNRAQGNPRQPVKPPLVLTLGDNLPSERRPFGSPGALARASATGSAAPKTGAAKPKTMVSAESFSKLPLSFEANVGQVEQIAGEATFGKDHVGFLSQGRSYALLLASDEAVLALRKPGVRRENRATRRLPGISGQSSKASDRGPQAMDVVRTKLQGASGAAKVTLLDELPGRVNYFIGNDPKKWRTDVPTYAKVKYQGVYPGIDLVYYGSQRQLEYDFVVAPGADPKAITLAVEAGLSRRDQSGGIKPPLRIDANGDVVVEAEDGQVRFHKPVAYQPRDWSDGPGNSEFTIQDSQFVDGRYVVTAGSRVHFDISAYDHSKPLIIDPVLSYSTFAGGNSGDFVSAVALDSSGNAYVTGKNDAGLVFVTKLSSDGASVVYNTVLGVATPRTDHTDHITFARDN